MTREEVKGKYTSRWAKFNKKKVGDEMVKENVLEKFGFAREILTLRF